MLALFAIVEYLPAPRESYFWDRAFDTGHFFVFGVGVVLCLTIARAMLGDSLCRSQYVGAGTFTLLLGVLLELWQSTRGRSAEWIDVYGDVMGILSFGAAYAFVDPRVGVRSRRLQAALEPGEAPIPPDEAKIDRVLGRLKGRKGPCSPEHCLLGFMALTLLLGLLPFLETLNLYRTRARILPTLVAWQESWNGKFYYVRDADLEVVDSSAAAWPHGAFFSGLVAKLTLHANRRYPGLVFHEPYADWSSYQAIEFDVFLDSTETIPFHFRFHDFAHNGEYNDRFNAEFLLHPGFQTQRFPIRDVRTASGRPIDLEHIASCALFTLQPDTPIILYLGGLRLVP